MNTATAMRQATQRAFGEPACHYRTADNPRPLCGQVAANGRGYARTRYSTEPARITCSKCRKALAKATPE